MYLNFKTESIKPNLEGAIDRKVCRKTLYKRRQSTTIIYYYLLL